MIQTRDETIRAIKQALKELRAREALTSPYESGVADILGGIGHDAHDTRLMLESLAEQLGYTFDHNKKALKR